MNILVTGANGQLGRSLRRALLSADAVVHSAPLSLVQLDDARYFFSDIAIAEEAAAYVLDITDRNKVEEFVAEHDIRLIINCAAYTNVDAAESHPDICHLLNATSVCHLAEAMKKKDGFLVHVSTDYVFGGRFHNRPIAEDAPAAPLGVYGESKLKGEQCVVDSGCRHVILRTAWLYSEFGHNFVKTMLRLAADREVLKVVADQCGTPTYASDLAEAILGIVRSGELDRKQGIYHFSNEGVCSWYDFAHAILHGSFSCKVLPCSSDEYPSSVTRPAYSVLDKTKFKTTFGRTIPHWTESLSRCLAALTPVQ